MAKIFDSVPVSKVGKSKFDLTHERKFTFDMGYLTPVMVQEVLPGDMFRVNTELMVRLQPMVAPVMHRVDVTVHYFFVPNRLIWDEFEDFITGGEDGSAAPVAPYFRLRTETCASGRLEPGQLADYMGLPTFPSDYTIDPAKIQQVSALPFRAYQLIYNEYYRDQNLTEAIDFSKASGLIDSTDFDKITAIRKRCWEKDYFTSALPWAQRGAEILMPIEGEGTPVYSPVSFVMKSNGAYADVDKLVGTSNTFGSLDVSKTTATSSGDQLGRIENLDSVDFSNTSVTINDFRRALALQKWLEASARGGARYTEQIRSHFDVISPDARLQRPEYLGGGKSPVVISEVLSTVQFEEDLPQGNMAGHGISVGKSNGFKKKFVEHGFIIGLASVLPRTAYQQGIDRMWTRFDKYDYAWPKLANIGEQAVANRELYYDGNTDTPAGTFGYQSRYSEYKYSRSTTHGDFRDELSYWTMTRIFNSAPALNTNFVESDPTKRIFAVTSPDTQSLYCQLLNRVDAIRPLPYYGVPAI